MSWNLYNARKKENEERPDTGLDLAKYQLKKPKKKNPCYDMRKEIAILTGKPVLQICGQTKGFTERELNGILIDAKNDAEKFKISVGARLWNLIKEVRAKKQNEKK